MLLGAGEKNGQPLTGEWASSLTIPETIAAHISAGDKDIPIPKTLAYAHAL